MLTLVQFVWGYSSVSVMLSSGPPETWRILAFTSLMALELAVMTSYVTVASTALYRSIDRGPSYS